MITTSHYYDWSQTHHIITGTDGNLRTFQQMKCQLNNGPQSSLWFEEEQAEAKWLYECL